MASHTSMVRLLPSATMVLITAILGLYLQEGVAVTPQEKRVSLAEGTFSEADISLSCSYPFGYFRTTIQWYKEDSNGTCFLIEGDSYYITHATNGRYSLSVDPITLSANLHISDLVIEDDGLYKCFSVLVSGNVLLASTNLVIESYQSELEKPVLMMSADHYPSKDEDTIKNPILNTSEVSFICLTSGAPEPINFIWMKNSAVLDVTNTTKYTVSNDTLRVYNVEDSDQGFYQCRAEIKTFGRLCINKVYLGLQLYYPDRFTPAAKIGFIIIGIAIGTAVTLSAIFIYRKVNNRTSENVAKENRQRTAQTTCITVDDVDDGYYEKAIFKDIRPTGCIRTPE